MHYTPGTLKEQPTSIEIDSVKGLVLIFKYSNLWNWGLEIALVCMVVYDWICIQKYRNRYVIVDDLYTYRSIHVREFHCFLKLSSVPSFMAINFCASKWYLA